MKEKSENCNIYRSCQLVDWDEGNIYVVHFHIGGGSKTLCGDDIYLKYDNEQIKNMKASHCTYCKDILDHLEAGHGYKIKLIWD